jgi:protocatechuate 3,4-dioxygenase beta subunit
VKSKPRAMHGFVVCIAAMFCAGDCLTWASGAVAQTSDSSQVVKAQVSGQVVRSDTHGPVPKAEVSLYPQDDATAKAAGGTRTVRTGADGNFIFSNLPPGAYALNVWRNGYATFSCETNRDCRQLSLKSGQKTDDLVLRLDPAGVISGRLFDEDQDPVEGIQVYLLRVTFLPGGRQKISARASVITDDQGSFRIANISPGSYFVRAGGLIEHPMEQVALKQAHGVTLQYRDTYYAGTSILSEATPLAVDPEVEASGIRFSVVTEKTYTITGKVVNGGKAGQPKPTEVHFTKQTEAEQMFGPGGSTINPDGSFELSGLSPGEYTLTAVATSDGVEDYEGYASVRIVNANVRANIELGRASEVRGKAEAPAGLSLAGKQIVLQANYSAYYPSDIGSDGQFDISNVPPGEYNLVAIDNRNPTELTYLKKAHCAGKDYALQPLVLAVGTVLDCDVALANDTGSVSGQVTEGEKPVAGLVVVSIPESPELRRIPRFTLTGKTDVAGRYQIVGVIPGDYLLFAVSPSEDCEYFALDFADRNQDKAEHVSLDSRATQVVNLKPMKGR